MKPILYSLVVCLFVTTIGFGQQDDNSKSILNGEWMFEFDKSFLSVKESSKIYLDSISGDELKIINSNYKGRRINFKSNGDFIQSLADGRQVSGTWTLDPQKKKIEIKLPNGAIFYQKLKIIDAKSILLAPYQEDTIIINKWYYTKL